MRIDVHHYHHYRYESDDDEISKGLRKLLGILNIHSQKLDKIMALDQESLALLVEINDATTEIGDDITDLINKPDASAAEFKAALRPIADKLKGIASQYTKDTPIEPPPPL